MRSQIWLSYLAGAVLVVLLLNLFGSIMAASLAKLHLSHAMAAVIGAAIILGGLINIPVARVGHTGEASVNPLAIFGLDKAFPQLCRTCRETIIAVNVGGCVIPVGLALYEFSHLAANGSGSAWRVGAAILANVAVCYFIARPVPSVGIAMPGVVPPLVAVAAALVLAPAEAAPVAFVAGVLGPLIGADLLHLKDISKIASTGIASIGGAGTFDGIVLSGIAAAYLA